MTPMRFGSSLVRYPGALRRLCCLWILASCVYGCSSSTQERGVVDTLRIGAAASATSEAMTILSEYVFAEPLLYMDWQGRTVERLASSWRWEDDGLTLHVELRPGVTMHDGRPVTAELVAGIMRAAAKGRPRLRRT